MNLTKSLSQFRQPRLVFVVFVSIAGMLTTQNASCESTTAVGQPEQSASSDPGREPLEETDIAEINRRFLAWGFDSEGARLTADEYANRAIVPYLIQVIDERRKSDLSPTERCLRQSAMATLAYTKDARGKALFRKILNEPLKEEMSYSDWFLIHGALLGLGVGADDATLDLLFEAATEEYWIKRNPKACRKGGTPKDFRDHMRIAALDGVAKSGSERAIKAFTSWEGLPEDKRMDQPWLLKGATRINKELTRIPGTQGNTEEELE